VRAKDTKQIIPVEFQRAFYAIILRLVELHIFIFFIWRATRTGLFAF
jgi:hypothetical protein